MKLNIVSGGRPEEEKWDLDCERRSSNGDKRRP